MPRRPDTYPEEAEPLLGKESECHQPTRRSRRPSSGPGSGRSRSPKIAADIGISESCLRTWLHQADVDDGRREGLTTEERVELVRLRRENRVLRMKKGDPGKSRGLLRQQEQLPLEVTYELVETEKADYPTTVPCRTLGISTSSFYEWRYRSANPSPRARRDAALTERIWRRRPPEGKTICHTDHGSQYTSWAFGRRLRAARTSRVHGIDRRLLR